MCLSRGNYSTFGNLRGRQLGGVDNGSVYVEVGNLKLPNPQGKSEISTSACQFWTRIFFLGNRRNVVSRLLTTKTFMGSEDVSSSTLKSSSVCKLWFSADIHESVFLSFLRTKVLPHWNLPTLFGFWNSRILWTSQRTVGIYMPNGVLTPHIFWTSQRTVRLNLHV